MTRARALSLVSLAVGAILAGAASAQEAVRVRGGEHATHSRLVIDAAPGATLAWGVQDGSMVVLIDGVAAFDTEAAARVGLSRVAGFETRTAALGAALVVRLNCDCGARVQRLADGRVVLDIATGAPKPPAPTLAAAETAPASASPQPSASPAPAPSPPPRPRSAPLSEPAVAAAPEREEPARTALVPAAHAPGSTAPVEALAEMATRTPPPTAPATPAPEAEVSPVLPPLALTQTVTDAATAPEAHAERADPARPTKDEAMVESVAPDESAIEEARKQLLQQLTRAAEQGLLTLRDPPAAPEETSEHAPSPETAEAAPPPPETQMRARSAIDIANERAPRTRNATPPGAPAHCAPDSAFAVADWAGAASFGLQIGEGRRALIGEFDTPDASAVLDYARLLIHFGFGAEARAALHAFSAQVAPPPLLLEMAAIVDGDAPPSAGELAAGVGCPGAHGLWGASAAALNDRLDISMLDLDALRQTLAFVPTHLRAAVALPIAEAALDQQALDVAEAITGVVARSEPAPPEGDGMVSVLLARIDAARGDHRRAEATLIGLIDQTTPAGVEAMIRLAEIRAARAVAPPPGLAENMEAIAFSQGGSVLGRRLLAAAAGARAASEGLAPALDALRRLAERAGDRAQAEDAARDMLVDYHPDPSEAALYAETVLAHWDLVGDGPEGDRARVAVARSLVALELGNLAEDLLAPALGRGDAAARLAAADAALSVAAPERAMAHVEGMAAPEAHRARAAALAAQFRYDEAVAEAAASGDSALESRYAWLAGNWARAAQAGDDVDRRILAAWMAGETDLPDDLRAAAEADPDLARRMEAFSVGATAAPSDTLKGLEEALEAARDRRALMGSLLGDG